MKRIATFISALLLTFGIHAQLVLNEDYIDSEKQQAFFQIAQNRNSSIDVNYHRFSWRLNPSQQFIAGTVYTEFTHLYKQNEISFDLLDNLTVSEVLYHDSSASFIHSNDVLTIFLPDSVEAKDSVKIVYYGSPFTQGLGTFVQDTTSAGDSVIWTLSQPYGASGWWPCNNSITDRIDSIDLFVQVPKGYIAASHGLLYMQKDLGNSTEFHWSHKHSIPAYLVAIAVGKYTLIEEQIALRNDSLLIQHFLYPQDVEPMRKDWQRTASMIQYYDSLLGPYPYADEKYGHAQFTRVGGMEHTTISFMHDFNPELLAHELIHHWSGNHVTCGSWQELWLNEGVTTYLSSFVYSNYYERDFYPEWKLATKKRVFERPNGTVFAADTSDVEILFDAPLRYHKPAFVMHMLNEKLGDSIFFQGMRNYLNDPKLTNNSVYTSDFINHMERVSEQDLSTFFNQWIYQPGFPILSISYEKIGSSVVVNWQQESSAKNGFNFTFDVEIGFYGPHGLTQSTLQIQGSSGSKRFTQVGDLDSLIIDPFNNTAVQTKESFRIYKLKEPTVFPNPTSNQITFQLPNLELINRVTITGPSGNLLVEDLNVNQTYLTMNVSNLPQATYQALIQSNSGTKYTCKFVVNK